MSNQASNHKHWLDTVEIISVVGSVGGAIASVFVQNVAIAAIPLSVSATLNLFNRRRLFNWMEEHHNQDFITLTQFVGETKETLTTNLDTHSQEASNKLNQVSQDLNNNLEGVRGDLNNKTQELKESLDNLIYEKTQLERIVNQLQQIENCSQAIRANPNCGEFYYQRGVSHQVLGDKQGAIEDYNQTIRLEPNHAGAHHQRGILYAELGERRKAVDDLRRAAKLYFEQGDIDSYQQARDLSKEFYEINTPTPEEAFEKIKLTSFLS